MYRCACWRLFILRNPAANLPGLNRLAIINIILIVLVRLLIITGLPVLKQMHALRIFYDFEDWAKLVNDKAGDNYVIFNEGFQNPSKYNFYNNTLKGFDYDPRYYRRTQYEFWPIEDSLQHKRAYYVLEHPQPGLSTDTINTPAGTWYGGWVDDVRTYQKIEFDATEKEEIASPGQQKVFDLTFKNPYHVPISFSNKGQLHQLVFEASFIVDTDVFSSQKADDSFNNISLKPGETAHFKFNVVAPVKPGKYQLVFSLRTDPFNGGRNSKAIAYTVR